MYNDRKFICFSEPFALYRISYIWYTTFGALTTIIIAGLGTFITGFSDPSLVDLKLLAPCIRKYIPANDSNKRLRKKPQTNRNAIPEVEEENESVL